MIKVGDKIPSVTLRVLTADGMDEITTETVFGGKTVALFGVPGAFTPTCSAQHLPSFLRNEEALKAKGVDAIACIAVNDPFVMKNWAETSGAASVIQMLPDGNAELTKAMGLEMDGTGFGLGIRSQRFAAVVKDSEVVHLAVEEPGAFEVSSGDAVLKHLNGETVAA
ncbi:MAG: peroxiredoxin [Alphaproteobacteria bacterium]|nr:peroxiredoxin [Alphaproteobacteria bacterium SS10]